MSDATVILGRDGMGSEADEADFEAWVSYVSERIDEEVGGKISVVKRFLHDVQDDRIFAEDEQDEDTVREALKSLWDDFCGDASAWPARGTEPS